MIQLCKRLMLAATFIVSGVMFLAPAAQAQATRTWVSGVGDDANPCSRTAPCRTFAGAISKTAAGGEINCLDPGAWGAVTVTKAITISCALSYGGILAAGTNGILVNAGANDIVTIRGLAINGANSGLNGIRFIAGGALIVENSAINNFTSANATGIYFQPSGNSRLTVRDTTVSNNGATTPTATGGGIQIQPTGTGSANVVLANVRVVNNSQFGLGVGTVGNTGSGILVEITDSVFGNNGAGVAVQVTPATTTVRMMVSGSAIASNVSGIVGAGSPTIRVADTDITNNGTGIYAPAPVAGQGVLSYGNNRLNGNTTDGAFSGQIAPQ